MSTTETSRERLATSAEATTQDASPDDASAAVEQARNVVDRRRRAFWIVGIGAAGLLFFLLGVGFLVERLTFYAPSVALDERLEAEGVPRTWEAAQAAAPKPPAELDGTDEWLALLDKRLPVEPYDPLDPVASEKQADAWIGDLRELAATGTYRVARYPIADVVESDFMVVLPGIDAENGLSRFLVERAKKQHAGGEFDGAAESLALTLPLCANAKYEPFLVCRLSGASRLGYSLDGIASLVDEADLSPARLEQLQRELERCDIESDLQSMRLHETLIQRDYALRAQLTDANLNPAERWMARRIIVHQLDLVDRLRRAEGLPPAERLAEFAAVDAEYQAKVDEAGAWTPQSVTTYAQPEFRADNVRHALLFLETANRRQALIAALACRRFEIERGELPRDWSDLAAYGIAEAPANAWTETPMTLARNGDGSVTIGALWIPDALQARESRRSAETAAKPFEGITLAPKTSRPE